jgi:hypothetical protein
MLPPPRAVDQARAKYATAVRLDPHGDHRELYADLVLATFEIQVARLLTRLGQLTPTERAGFECATQRVLDAFTRTDHEAA